MREETPFEKAVIKTITERLQGAFLGQEPQPTAEAGPRLATVEDLAAMELRLQKLLLALHGFDPVRSAPGFAAEFGPASGLGPTEWPESQAVESAPLAGQSLQSGSGPSAESAEPSMSNPYVSSPSSLGCVDAPAFGEGDTLPQPQSETAYWNILCAGFSVPEADVPEHIDATSFLDCGGWPPSFESKAEGEEWLKANYIGPLDGIDAQFQIVPALEDYCDA